MNLNDYLVISEKVKEALKNNKPIVALESTIISHGMPYPKNVETALQCEQIILDNGCIPATIAIINGKLKVGLSHDEIDYLGREGRNVTKVSRRDIPYILALNKNGATTVSATMYIASLANIKIFATGGIGGVHRGAELTMDISCDLEELGKTNVNVVCAGAKAILDLPKTLEYLETKGVLVIGYKTEKLPAFYSSSSEYNVDIRVDDPLTIAKIINVKRAVGLNGGILITNPIPKEFEVPHEVIDKVIDEAIKEMNDLGIHGKESTPFLLAKICELTHGTSLESNIKLVFNNCKLACEISKGIE
ncbi:MAG: pseudouridine-5'-phosphate glycosidase [Acholeplasmataceae bacterium]|nr:pseudouridine-5'-phosphate glycosidase [Acholeplasmataceae bacterium]